MEAGGQPSPQGEGFATDREPPQLVGREAEQTVISELLDSVRQGTGAVLVLRGEPGVGKTSQLEQAISFAEDLLVVRFVGIESEMRLEFAALQALLAPFADGVVALPAPQAEALGVALGLVAGVAPDPFLVGLAALTLLSGAAARRGILLVVDDAQWLDDESAAVLGFIARRLYADRIGLLIAMRDPSDFHAALDGLPRLDLRPLSELASRQLLTTSVGDRVADHIQDRILEEAGGNPLALVELARELSSGQLAGVSALPEPLRVGERLESRFLRQVQDLPADAQTFLLTVAAEPTGDPLLVWRAGRHLDFDERALEASTEAYLLVPGPPLRFRHPLIRSAIYQGASDSQRRRVHAALAAATDVERDPGRRAWHRAAATAIPDTDVADELERAAGRSQSHPATAAWLERSAELTPDSGRRALRFLLAATAHLTAGSSDRAHANVSRAIPDLDDAVLVAQARRLQAASLFIDATSEVGGALASPGRNEEIISIVLDAAVALGPLDIRLGRDAASDALLMATYFADRTTISVATVAEAAMSLELPADLSPTTADLVLDALTKVFVEGFAPAMDALRRARAAVLVDPAVRDLPRAMGLGCWVGFALGDDAAVRSLAGEMVALSRDRAAFQALREALSYLAHSELRCGSLVSADAYLAELIEIEALAHRVGLGSVMRLMVTAWRGREAEVRSAAAILGKQASDLGLGLLVGWVEQAVAILELGLGNYAAASRRSFGDAATDLAFGPLKVADEIEAHVRGGDREVAKVRLAWLSDRAEANGSRLELGLLARSRALLADGADVEARFEDSAALLLECEATLHLARTQLLYGEWLRRQKRRRDARVQLDSALEVFESAGVSGFAERARVELRATGVNARKRVDETRDDLTSQEDQIARLAAAGATNPEIAARLFISASTVDYHLRKVYRKLGIRSRRELVRTSLSRS